MTEKQAITRIASYCSKAERCEYDVRKKLVSWEFDTETINKIVLLLQKENFLNEERFCRSFIKDKMRFNKWGRNKITFELRKKNISDSVIQSVFDELKDVCDFEASLLKILLTKLPSVKANNYYEKRAKLYRFAMSRGFAPELAQKCITKILGDSNSDEFYI